jgi:predicted dehydrogenase
MNGAVVVGCGRMGRKRAEALRALGVPVRAVVDTDEQLAGQLADDLGSGVVATTDAAAACGRDDVDFAVVATTHDHLAPLTVVALEHGCDVLVEKPGARSVAELDTVRAAAADARRSVRVGYNHRFHPAIRAARDEVRSGRFGGLFSIRARYGHGGRLGYEHEWRADRLRSGGGELLDQGSHLVDLTRFLAGAGVELAFAELRTDFWPMAVEDNAYLALRTEAGAFAWLHASWTEWKNCFEMELALRTARLDVRGLGGSYGPERLVVHEMAPELGPPATSEQVWDGPDGSWQAELADARAAIAGEPAIGAGLDDARAVLRVVEEAYRR